MRKEIKKTSIEKSRKIKLKGFTIAMDFFYTGRITYEKGKNCSTLYLYFFMVWFIKGSLVEFIKKIKSEPPTGGIHQN